MWGLYVVYSSIQWDIYVQHGKHICWGEHDNNVECMHTCASVYTVDCSEFILDKYWELFHIGT